MRSALRLPGILISACVAVEPILDQSLLIIARYPRELDRVAVDGDPDTPALVSRDPVSEPVHYRDEDLTAMLDSDEQRPDRRHVDGTSAGRNSARRGPLDLLHVHLKEVASQTRGDEIELSLIGIHDLEFDE
jgi:hypothetical protein